MTRWMVVAALVAGCAGERTEPVAPKTSAAVETYGAPLSEAAIVDLETVIAAPKDHDGKTVKVKGRVKKVCQKKGCWMTLTSASPKPDHPRVRVTFKGYSFFVPKDLSGSDVVAEGEFRVKTIPKEEAQHYADDEAEAGAAPARKVTGDEVELSLVASGVQVLR